MSKVTCEQYTTTTCGVCKMTKMVIDKAVSIFTQQELDFKRLVCDSNEADMARAQEMGVSTMPTFIFYVGGKEKFRHEGAMNLPLFKGKVNELLDEA